MLLTVSIVRIDGERRKKGTTELWDEGGVEYLHRS